MLVTVMFAFIPHALTGLAPPVLGAEEEAGNEQTQTSHLLRAYIPVGKIFYNILLGLPWWSCG